MKKTKSSTVHTLIPVVKHFFYFILGSCILPVSLTYSASAATRSIDQEVTCDLMVAGGGLSGAATAYEALKAGHTVCMTEITDWVGGQISSQGTSALDEKKTQRDLRYFPKGYLEFRQQLLDRHKNQKTPGNCWVSLVCFLPKEGDEILEAMLNEAARDGKGTLRFFPNTVVKDLQIGQVGQGQQIQSVRAIQHSPAVGAPPLNTYPLSQTIVDSYQEADSSLFKKKIIRFVPPASGKWFVIEATETGELLALADLPYRLGVDALSHTNPSSSSETDYPYCPQAFTYTFAMESTDTPQPATPPAFYSRYAQSYSFNSNEYAQHPELVFTYRRIFSGQPTAGSRSIIPGDISMQNWNWGNDYGPGTPADNYLYTRDQLAATGQLTPGGWLGGFRVSALQGGEEQALGFFYWFHSGTTDAKLPTKKPFPNIRYLQGLESPMGTVHGLSKYPYMREARRLIGRYAYGYPDGFLMDEISVSRKNFKDRYYVENLSPEGYRNLVTALSGLNTIAVLRGQISLEKAQLRTRSHIYPDTVGIGHYNLDFHPCMVESPPERAGNQERPKERQGADETYPFQIPLRSMIPPKIDNLLVTGKSIAMSHISASAYRVHAIEWSAGAAAGTTAVYSLETGILPYQLVENLPRANRNLEQVQKRLTENGNPIAFPNTSILNLDWKKWR
ncbi:FAD-dependent oxidoreductase [Phormidesmis sp. 146-35]